MIYSKQISSAIAFAIETHEGQVRKGKKTPYITHPLTVGIILGLAGASEDAIVAGILHDTIEDSKPDKKVTRAILEERFGEEGATLVDSVTEQNKDLSWEERKHAAHARIKTFSHGSLLVKSADIISNGTEIIADYEQDGEQVFKRFKATKEKTIEHYQLAIATIIKRWAKNPLIDDLRTIADTMNSMMQSESMTEEGVAERHSMKEPTQCVLWKKPELVGESMKERFELLDTYEDESHFWRFLLKCRECGQRYFFQFEEEIDWTGGNDPQYSVYIPIETDIEITMLKNATPSDLYSFTPRIQESFPSDAKEPTVRWVGVDS